MSNPTKSKTKTTKEIAAAIEKLRRLLDEEYKSDFSFVVLGRGQVLGASTVFHGKVVATKK